MRKGTALHADFLRRDYSPWNYTSLVSLDNQGVFDNVEWHDKLIQLRTLNCHRNIVRLISSYLLQRSVLKNWRAGNLIHQLQKGCHQCSCLGTIFWLLVANELLVELHRLGYTLFAGLQLHVLWTHTPSSERVLPQIIYHNFPHIVPDAGNNLRCCKKPYPFTEKVANTSLQQTTKFGPHAYTRYDNPLNKPPPCTRN